MLSNLRNKNIYHGSYMEVREPNLKKCKYGKDFGRGFYLTTDRRQAIDFAKTVAKREGIYKGVLNIYKFSNFDDLDIFEFEGTTAEWLHCVVGNRNIEDRYLAKKYKGFDALLGKVADDDTSTVINAYMVGAYGPVGSDIAVKTAVDRFLVSNLKNQICLRTNDALKKIEFFRSEDVWL